MRMLAVILAVAILFPAAFPVFVQAWDKTIYEEGLEGSSSSTWSPGITVSRPAGAIFTVVDVIPPEAILTETWSPGLLSLEYSTDGYDMQASDVDGLMVMTNFEEEGPAMAVKTYTLLAGCWTQTAVGEHLTSFFAGAGDQSLPTKSLGNFKLRKLNGIGIYRPITVTQQPDGPVWTKTVDGVSWTSGLSREKETADTVPVSDILNQCGILTETWNPERLSMDYALVNANVIENSSGRFVISSTGAPAYVTKTYTMLPCDWESVTVNEQFQYFNGSSYTTETRPFTLTKDPPVLAIAGQAETQKVLPGSLATFSLTCGNTGGFDNAVSVISYFPAEAPYVSAVPTPTIVTGTDAVEWQFPNGLSVGDPCGFEVTVQILPNTQVGTPIVISNVIVGHTRAVADIYPDPGDPQEDPYVFITGEEPDPPATVSTLTEWGLLLFALLLAAGSVLVLRRHHKA